MLRKETVGLRLFYHLTHFLHSRSNRTQCIKRNFQPVRYNLRQGGLANPNALLLANAAFEAVMKIGWPEGRIPLAEATVYLATSPKSNSAYEGINSALELVRQTGNLPVPLHLRNAPTKLMKQLGYGKDYKYAHAYKGNFVKQDFLPEEIRTQRIWHAQDNPSEQKLKERMVSLWGDRFKE